MRKNGKFVRMLRIEEIAKMISSTFPEGCNFDKLLIELQYQGFKEKTARKYLEIIMKRQGWILKDGNIVSDIEG